MIRAWIGIALLSSSWLLGTGFYQGASPCVWLLLLVLGTWLLGAGTKTIAIVEGWAVRATSAVLFLAAAWLVPWPDRVAPLWLGAGLVLLTLPVAGGWAGRAGRTLVAAGVVLLAQSLALAGYTALTARSHDLPAPLSAMLAGLMRLVGVEAAEQGGNIVVDSMRQSHALGATWDLLVDPASLCFLVGGAAWLAMRYWARPAGRRRWAAGLAASGTLVLVVAAWLPLRATGMVAIYLHRNLCAAEGSLPHLMNHFLCPWVHLFLLAIPAVAAWRLVERGAPEEVPAAGPAPDGPAATSAVPVAARAEGPAASPRRAGVLFAAALVAAGAAVAAMAVDWELPGTPKAGRVMFVERHSTWSSTLRPYDTNRYGEEGSYNYGAVFDYCRHFFSAIRLQEDDSIDDRTLAQCDVVVVRIPTARYAPEEIDALLRFVENGGGLLLIGDHTNVLRSGTYLNDIARRFDFLYRYDVLYDTESPLYQPYRPPLLAPHPIVQYVPPMDFAITCSIDPGTSRGRAAITNAGLWSLGPDYNDDTANFQPGPLQRSDLRCGAFIQAWSVRHGLGRVVAFTDSTLFSNFCTFEPGKSEMLLGLLQWLNQRNALAGDPQDWLFGLSAILLGAGLLLGRSWAQGWLPLLAVGVLGFAAGATAAETLNRWSVPPAPLKRPLDRAVIDRAVSSVPLADDGFSRAPAGFGLLEQWIPRLGWATARRSGPGVFDDAALVVIQPSGPVSDDYRRRLMRYVEEGGRLVVLDSPENRDSTANSLLWGFGLSVRRDRTLSGKLTMEGAPAAASIRVQRACALSGGQPLASLGTTPVAARRAYGRGSVLAMGFASCFNDRSMSGVDVAPQGEPLWQLEPDATMLERYQVLYRLLRLGFGELGAGAATPSPPAALPPAIPGAKVDAERPGKAAPTEPGGPPRKSKTR